MGRPVVLQSLIFFFNDTATTEIYTLSLHDALPICSPEDRGWPPWPPPPRRVRRALAAARRPGGQWLAGGYRSSGVRGVPVSGSSAADARGFPLRRAGASSFPPKRHRV